MLHLHLVEARLDHLDRVLDGADVHIRRGELLQRGVEGGGLAGSGRPRDQNDAVRLLDHAGPQRMILVGQTKITEAAHQHLGVKDAHHQLLAKRRGQRRQTQLHLATAGHPGFQAPVLRPAFFREVHAPENFQPAGHGHRNSGRQVVDVVQHTIDPEPHIGLLAARLDMDIAGALLERVLQQPVDDADDMLVVGIGVLLLAELHQLLEIGQPRGGPLQAARTAHRFGEAVELHRVAIDIGGIHHHAPDRSAQGTRQVRLPVRHQRLGARDHHFPRIAFDRKDAMAPGKSK